MTRSDSSARQPLVVSDLPADGKPEPVVAAEKTVWRLTFVEFPWDINKALEFALLRTYAVPAISGLLARTGEFERRTARRYDDTALLIREVLRNGLDSDRARRSFARIDAMHGRFQISPDDYLYVLSNFTFSPIDWLEAFGRRPMTEEERQDWFLFWNEFGRRMGISGLFETIDHFRAFARDFESRRCVYAPTNRLIAEQTIDLVLATYHVPRALRPSARPVALAICEPPLVATLGFPQPPPVLRAIVGGALRLRKRALGLLPPNREPHWLKLGRRTYPNGYAIEELGTFPPAAATDA